MCDGDEDPDFYSGLTAVLGPPVRWEKVAAAAAASTFCLQYFLPKRHTQDTPTKRGESNQAGRHELLILLVTTFPGILIQPARYKI